MPAAPAIAIVDFTPADEAATLAFCQEIFAEQGWPLAFLDPHTAAAFAQPGDAFLLVRRQGRIIGCAGLKHLTPDEVLLTRFFLAPAERGSGLAARLFACLVARARRLGYAAIVLDVNRESHRAIRFYQRMGMEPFTPTPHPRWLESAPEERQYAWYFRLPLAAPTPGPERPG